MMLEVIGTLVGSIVSGGATGILGVVAQRFADYKNKELDLKLEDQRAKNEIEKRKIDVEIAQAEAAAKVQVAQVEGESAKEVADAQAFAASYNLEPKRYSGDNLTPNQQWMMVLVDAMRGIVRPALTIYLCVLVTVVYWMAREKLHNEDLTANEAIELFKYIVATILYVWTTITLWWFGTRNKQTQPGR